MPLDIVAKAETRLFRDLERLVGYRLFQRNQEIQDLAWQLTVKVIAAAVKGEDQYVSKFHVEGENDV